MSSNNRYRLPRRLTDGAFDSKEHLALERTLDYIYDTDIDTGDTVYIRTVADFPDDNGTGIIQLADRVTYVITGNVDLLGARLVGGVDTAIIGGSSENCIISSTGLVGTALLSSAYSLPMRFIGITADVALDLDADGTATAALDWIGVNFLDCPTMGTIANYNNFIAADCGVLNSANLTFDGTLGTIGFSQCIFDGRDGETTIIIAPTAVITRRFRIIYSAFVTLAGETSLDVSTDATIPVDAYILDTLNFSGGGTYIAGVQHDDNKSLFANCRGVSNTGQLSYYTMTGNAVATTISDTVTAVKVAGTTVSQDITQKFTNTANRATYTGALTQVFKVTGRLSCTSGNNHQIGVYIAKNGTVATETEAYITTNGTGRAEGAVVQGIFELSTNNYIEIFVENSTSATNITVTELSVIVESLT